MTTLIRCVFVLSSLNHSGGTGLIDVAVVNHRFTDNNSTTILSQQNNMLVLWSIFWTTILIIQTCIVKRPQGTSMP